MLSVDDWFQEQKSFSKVQEKPQGTKGPRNTRERRAGCVVGRKVWKSQKGCKSTSKEGRGSR